MGKKKLPDDYIRLIWSTLKLEAQMKCSLFSFYKEECVLGLNSPLLFIRIMTISLISNNKSCSRKNISLRISVSEEQEGRCLLWTGQSYFLLYQTPCWDKYLRKSAICTTLLLFLGWKEVRQHINSISQKSSQIFCLLMSCDTERGRLRLSFHSYNQLQSSNENRK